MNTSSGNQMFITKQTCGPYQSFVPFSLTLMTSINDTEV